MMGAPVAAQDHVLVDSLQEELLYASHDTTRVQLLIELVDHIYDDNVWPTYNDKALKICQKNLPFAEGRERYVFLLNKAHALNNIGYQYKNQGNIFKGLEFYQRAFNLYDTIGFEDGQALALTNMAIIHSHQKEVEKAFEYSERALKINEKIDKKYSIALVLNNLGSMYRELGDNPKALQYFERALKIQNEIGEERGAAYTLGNIASMYTRLNDTERAKSLLHQSLVIHQRFNDRQGIGYSFVDLGTNHLVEKNIDSAYFYAKRGFTIARELGFPKDLKDASELLSKLYVLRSDFEGAYEMHVLYKRMSDSIFSEQTQLGSVKQRMQFEHEKEKVALKKDQERQAALHNEALKRQQLIMWAFVIGLVVVLIFSAFLFNRFRVTQRQKAIIEQQKSAVEEQKAIVEKKNKKIGSSINYAKRIQNAIVPESAQIALALPEHVMFWKPMDVVSGDFPWFHQSDDAIYFAAADCTGHGVPGAFVSMACHNVLNQVVIDYGESDPGKILSDVHQRVLHLFRKKDATARADDGMDVAFCKYLKAEQRIEFAGAYRPLVRVRNGELTELKTEHWSIGGRTPEDYQFETQSLAVLPGDWIYMYSDGFCDQFGGPLGKKFMSKNFKNLLVKCAALSPDEQEQFLNANLEEWQGSLDRVDDILVVGFKI